jgi:hypothetical protein
MLLVAAIAAVTAVVVALFAIETRGLSLEEIPH